MKPEINIKRIYEPADKNDGFRILVDRLWPRGLRKEDLQIDEWIKEIGPSTELRKWFHHETPKWDEFVEKYRNELNKNPAVDQIREMIRKHKKVSLLYGAKDEQHNQAVVLKDFLEKNS